MTDDPDPHDRAAHRAHLYRTARLHPWFRNGRYHCPRCGASWTPEQNENFTHCIIGARRHDDAAAPPPPEAAQYPDPTPAQANLLAALAVIDALIRLDEVHGMPVHARVDRLKRSRLVEELRRS